MPVITGCVLLLVAYRRVGGIPVFAPLQRDNVHRQFKDPRTSGIRTCEQRSVSRPPVDNTC